MKRATKTVTSKVSTKITVQTLCRKIRYNLVDNSRVLKNSEFRAKAHRQFGKVSKKVKEAAANFARKAAS